MASYSIIRTRREYKTRLKPITFGVLLGLFLSQKSFAANDIQFNTDVLDVKDRSSIDLTQFSRAGYLMPGKYQLAPRVNKSEFEEQTIEFFVPDNDPKDSKACLTSDLVKTFGLKDSVVKDLLWWHKNQCLDETSLEGLVIRPDLGTGALYITIPQAYLEYTSPNWDPPSRWDNGIPGLLFDYNINALTSHQSSGGQDKSVSGNGTTGANMGPWRLRADWQAQYEQEPGTETQKSWDWSRYYAYRAITSLKAKLMLGENYLDSSMFDSFRYAGMSLATDDSQLPPNLRGYAPEVTGVAKTNAKVTISQQDRVIYETTVPAGPFRIQDLNTAVMGKLDVKIQEQDGSIRTFQVDTADVPYLTRPGLVRYKVAAGKPSDYDHHSEGPGFTTGEFSWGVNNGWSLYGGGLFAGDYNALAVGIGRDLLALGALSFDVTESRAELPHQDSKQGGSYRLSYSKRFDQYDSQVTFAGYRFSERDFMSMSQYLDARYDSDNASGYDKELYTVTFNKQFRTLNMSAYVNYSHQTYWDRPASDTWNISIANYFDFGKIKDISVSLSAYSSEYEDSKDNGAYVGLSIPWGTGTLNYDGQFDGDGNSHTVGFYDRIDDNNNYRINAGTTMDGRGTGSGYFTHEGDIAEMSANASVQGSEYNAFGLSLQGGMTATSEGAALHRQGIPGGTRMMVDTGGVSGVPISGSGGVTYANRFGKAVVSDISSYYHTGINVDLDKLPSDMEATRSVVEGTLTEGAIGYRKFGILAGGKAMATIRLADGSAPPFGAEVSNHSGIQTGIVGDSGNVWLAGIQKGEAMDIAWGGQKQCSITLPSSLPPPDKGLLLPCIERSEDRK